jgi:hypothetical protein
MGIQSNFDMSALRRYAYEQKDKFVEAALEAYRLACIQMVDRAKQTNTYQDQTHKLRSSIGCVLYHNGVEVFNYFESTGGEKGGEGVQQGIAYARSIAEQQGNKTIVAVVVAGAEYALYVEAGHNMKKKDGTKIYVTGQDVLTGSTRQFSSDLKVEFDNVKNAFKEHVKGKFDL